MTDRPAVLLLRVWRQDADLRCRLMVVTDPSSPPSALAAAQGVDAICEEVRRWLQQQI
jgi:acetaldehyde dehydrogenase (acetylating)